MLDEELETIPQTPDIDHRSTFTEYGEQFKAERDERFLRNPTQHAQENLNTSTRRKDDMNKGLGSNANTGMNQAPRVFSKRMFLHYRFFKKNMDLR